MELCKFFNYKDSDVLENLTEKKDSQQPRVLTVKHPIISSDNSKNATEMDKLENLVDTNNGFLMKAFEEFFYEIKQDVEETEKKMTKGENKK